MIVSRDFELLEVNLGRSRVFEVDIGGGGSGSGEVPLDNVNKFKKCDQAHHVGCVTAVTGK